MRTLDYPNSTETMAELAWRYGEQGVRHWSGGGYLWFPDGTAMNRWQVHTPLSLGVIRDTVEALLGRAG